TVEEIRKNRSVRLQAWARIEGFSKSLDEPARQLRLSLRLKGAPPPPDDLLLGNFEGHTDESGHFVFPQVPPDSLEIMIWRPDPRPASTGFFGSGVVSVETKPGETSQVTVSTPTVSTR